MINADVTEAAAEVPDAPQRVNPALQVGQLCEFNGTYPTWEKGQAHDEPPTGSHNLRGAIDLRNASIVLTDMHAYEQIRGGSANLDSPDAQWMPQAELSISLPGAKILIQNDEGEWLPHPFYTARNASGLLSFEQMTTRALECYVKTPFNTPIEVLASLRDTLVEAGWKPSRNEHNSIARNEKFHLVAPVSPTTTSLVGQIQERQKTGFKLDSLTLLNGDPERSPEFRDFLYSITENMRWVTALLGGGYNLSQSFSLSTAITGIDHSNPTDNRPMGNALRATIGDISYVPSVSDDEVRAKMGLGQTDTVTPAMKSLMPKGEALSVNFFANTNVEA